MSIFDRAGVLIWGILSHAYEILPKILAALKLFGFDKWETAIRELHAVKIISIAQLFEKIGALFFSKAQLLRELHEEGTRPRFPGEEDMFTEDRVAYYLKAMWAHDEQMKMIEGAGEEVTLALASAASVGPRDDVSQSPTLNC
jgi:hypothetical protein